MLAQYQIKMTLTSILHRSPSPHRNICLPVRRTVCRTFLSNCPLFLLSAFSIHIRRASAGDAVHTFHKSFRSFVPVLTLQIFVEAWLTRAFVSFKTRALPNLFDAHFLHCLPNPFCQIHDKTCGFAHSIPNRPKEGATCSDQSSSCPRRLSDSFILQLSR